jgi:predicted nucleotidyltransferase
MLNTTEIEDLVGRVVARARPRKVILFGSYAKGTARIGSDVDLAVVRETELQVARRGDDIKPVLASTLVPVDLHVFTPEEMEEYGRDESSFVNTVLTTGRVVFEDH